MEKWGILSLFGGSVQKGSYVSVHLIEPSERLWGRLFSLDPAGVVLRGIDIGQVEAFKYQVKHADRAIYAQTFFFPMRRVLKIDLDEPIGSLPSVVETITRIADLGEDEIIPLD